VKERERKRNGQREREKLGKVRKDVKEERENVSHSRLTKSQRTTSEERKKSNVSESNGHLADK
jgi:hypothetical protein